METFSAVLAICAGNSPLSGEFPAQRPVTRSFNIFFDLRLKKRLSKQWWGWWFETLSYPLWRQFNALKHIHTKLHCYASHPVISLLIILPAIQTITLTKLACCQCSRKEKVTIKMWPIDTTHFCFALICSGYNRATSCRTNAVSNPLQL